ncbi:MAG: hypothetical protein A2X58_13165 [Nitrospirae bacterium GWC2_56_14]|nr:MAG: hypothetical protein A2X58_13165 [Nitrospirae bacterium GWC2_56_14]
MSSAFSILGIVVALFLGGLFIGWLVSLYNSLVQVSNNMRKAWENIDVLLVQRNEELPKLVEIVKTYAGYEQEVLQSLTALRLAYSNARTISARTNMENQLRYRLNSLQAVGERYPDLKADRAFGQLMERVSAIEDSIGDRRAFFNETVNIYNTQIGLFPQLIFAAMMGYGRHPYLKEASGSQTPEGT